MRKEILLVLLVATFSVACDAFKSSHPSAPTPVGGSGRTPSADLSAWRPCVVVHAPGGRTERPFQVQMDTVRRLHAAGRMEWIRLGYVGLNGNGKDYAIEAKRIGLKVFGIISLEQLQAGSSWENVFDQFYARFPEVDMWEIAGEITNADPSVNIQTMQPREYMEKLRRLYTYVKERHPRAILTSAPTFGSVGGPAELEEFIRLGLLDMDIVVALNIYTENALQEYAAVFDRYAYQMAKRRVWITETGTPGIDQQVAWVEQLYPRMVHTFRPEMICWYVMWDGDRPVDSTHGLMTGIYTSTPIAGDLLKRLIGS